MRRRRAPGSEDHAINSEGLCSPEQRADVPRCPDSVQIENSKAQFSFGTRSPRGCTILVPYEIAKGDAQLASATPEELRFEVAPEEHALQICGGVTKHLVTGPKKVLGNVLKEQTDIRGQGIGTVGKVVKSTPRLAEPHAS